MVAKMARSKINQVDSRMDRIEERLAKIEEQVTRLVTVTEGVALQIARHDTEQEKAENRVEEALHGSNDKPGLEIRIDRLEQAHERSVWVTRSVVGAVLTLLVGAIWALVR